MNNKIGHLSEQSAQDTLVEGSILDDDQVSTWFIFFLVKQVNTVTSINYLSSVFALL